MIAAAVCSVALAAMLGQYALRLEPAHAGRFAPDLTGPQRWYTSVAIALLGGAAGATAALVAPARPASVALVLAAATAPALAFIDIRAMRLPLALSGLLAAAAVCAFSADALVNGTWAQARSALGAASAIGLLTLMWWYVAGGRIGLGDVALIAVIALYLGWYSWALAWLGILIALLIAAAVAATHKLRHHTRGDLIPAGPSLLAGWWLTTLLTMTP
ncbi:prepilin peptidase [Glycomyces sp. NPDC047010]|uniref:prepilin peptidase n=1 Tax=Glycomyces sp. NPDC047010 TaxID=3155023 RepID=UPI0033E5843B